MLGTARLAGIMAAKRTSDLIPLCHPIALTRVEVELELEPAQRSVRIRGSVEAFDRTGVEMEALTSVSAAALTVYDMLKAFDRSMVIGSTQLLEKSGGKSGDFRQRGSRRRTGRALPDQRSGVVGGRGRAARRALPDAGGISVFIGTVRDHNQGHPVRLLEYQAYASMAVKEMERIAIELEDEIPGRACASSIASARSWSAAWP